MTPDFGFQDKKILADNQEILFSWFEAGIFCERNSAGFFGYCRCSNLPGSKKRFFGQSRTYQLIDKYGKENHVADHAAVR